MAYDLTSQYVNTMVFAVVAGIISLMLLLLIMRASDTVKQYGAFIITVEIGLVVIIAIAVYRIIAFERRLDRDARAGTGLLMSVKTCPDYWTSVDGNMCITGFRAAGKPYSYRILGKDDRSKSENPVRMLQLSDYDGKSVQFACNQARAKVGAPWTDVDAVCGSYRM